MSPLTFPVGILTRVEWTLVIVAGGLAGYWLMNRLILLRASRHSSNAYERLPGARRGVPAILYFTTPDCIPCKTVQRPALNSLQTHLGDKLQVIEVNAQEQPDLASHWGVLSVPTTFLIDSHGKLVHVNHGVTRTEKLLEQVTALQE